MDVQIKSNEMLQIKSTTVLVLFLINNFFLLKLFFHLENFFIKILFNSKNLSIKLSLKNCFAVVTIVHGMNSIDFGNRYLFALFGILVFDETRNIFHVLSGFQMAFKIKQMKCFVTCITSIFGGVQFHVSQKCILSCETI